MLRYPHGTVALVLDCADLDRAADFWCGVLGLRRAGDVEGSYLSLTAGADDGIDLLLQRVPETKAQKNRLHLDLRTPDRSAEVARVLELGGSIVSDEPLHEDGWSWQVLADPDGNEFCVIEPPAASTR